MNHIIEQPGKFEKSCVKPIGSSYQQGSAYIKRYQHNSRMSKWQNLG